MADQNSFQGFSKKTVSFLKALKNNNEKAWFEAHKEEFEADVIAPAKHFVAAMGEKLHGIAPDIQADPRVNRSIFRVYRDVRFSKDKTPYKTHLGILLWEGKQKKMENPGFYFHLEPPTLLVGSGMYMFTKEQMEFYRQEVMDEKRGASLHRIINKITSKGGLFIGGEGYKRVPSEFDPKHKRAQLLLHKGLWAGSESPIPPELYSDKLIGYVYDIYKELAPLHKWLLDMTRRM